MATFENKALGLRGVLLRNGERVWLEPGATLEIAKAAIKLMPHGVEMVEPLEQAPAPRNPLDHDGDGKAGGSLKGEASTAAKGRRRKRG